MPLIVHEVSIAVICCLRDFYNELHVVDTCNTFAELLSTYS